MVGNILAGQKPMQKGLGTPVKVKKFWIDVIVPEGPPLEYERSGYVFFHLMIAVHQT